MTLLLKDPEATLDYSVDWGAEYLSGDALAQSDWTVSPVEPGGVTVASSWFDLLVATAEVVTADQVDIDSRLVIENDAVIDVCNEFIVVDFEVELGVLDEHRPPFDTDIPAVVASDSWGCQRGRGKRRHNGQLPHRFPLSHAFRDRIARTSYERGGFGARLQIFVLLPKCRTNPLFRLNSNSILDQAIRP